MITSDNIALLENGDISEDDNEVSHIFNDFFSNAVKNLNIEGNEDFLTHNDCEPDPVIRAIIKKRNTSQYSKD